MTAQDIAAHDVITFADLKMLANASAPCITFLTHIQSPFELSARLKNGLRSVQRKLEGRQISTISSDLLLEPIRELAAATEIAGIWSNALIVFRSPDVFRYFLLQRRVPEMETVEDRFQIRPLLSALSREQRFHVLGLSRRRIRLLRCTQHQTEEEDIRRIVPENMEIWLNNRQPDHVLDNRSTAGPSVGSMKGVTFGTSTDREREDQYVAHFFKDVDRGINILLRGDATPLLLAGVESEIAAYRRVNTYPHLRERVVTGSPDGFSNQELHRRAMEMVVESHSELLEKALSDFEKSRDTSRISSDTRKVIQAAWEGRIADLFISEGAELKGAWNEEKHEIEIDGLHEDLLNAAALQTVLHGGRAFVLEEKDMPAAKEAIAVLRF